MSFQSRSSFWATRLLASVALSVLLSSCGGGSDRSADLPSASLRGRFVDAPVAGLTYATADQTGVTDADGFFQYSHPGESIQFAAGALLIGQARASSDVHVYDLVTTQDEQSVDRNVRVAQLLQSLDMNRGTTDTIRLPVDLASKLSASEKIDWMADQATFDLSLKGLLGKLGLDGQFVANSTARAKADAFLVASLASCPLTAPGSPDQPGDSFAIIPGSLTCLDIARINFYTARVKPLLDDQITGALGQTQLVEEAWSAEAAGRLVDIHPLTVALNTVDSYADAADALVREKWVEATANVAKAVLDNTNAIVKTLAVFEPTDGTAVAESAKAQAALEIASKISDVIANAADCHAVFSGKPDVKADVCAKAIVLAFDSLALVSKTSPFKRDTAASQKDVEDALKAISSTIAIAGQIQDLASKANGDRDAAARAAFGLAGGIVSAARNAVTVVYSAKGQAVPTTGGVAIALGVVDYSITPVLELGKKCYGSVTGTDRVQCVTAIARESFAAGTRLAVSAYGNFEAVRTSGEMNEAIVARAVIEEVLWAGQGGAQRLLNKYFPGEAQRTLANSGEDLIVKIAKEKRSLNAVISYLEWQKVLYASVVLDQNSFNLVQARDLSNTYLSMIQLNAQPNFSAPSIRIASVPGATGEVQVRVVVAPEKSGISGGRILCSASEAVDYAPSSPWRGEFSGVTPLDFTIRFGSSGKKALLCSIYTAGPSVTSRFVGSNAAILEPHLPAVPSVSRFSVSPAKPRVGDTVTLSAEGKNLQGSGFRFSNFSPCDTGGAVAPDVLADTLMSYQCVAKKATAISYVGVLDASGVPLSGIGQSLIVYCAGGLEPVSGGCPEGMAINLPAASFVRGENVALSANGNGTDTLMNAPPYLSGANAAEWDFTVATAGTYELFAEYAAALSRPVVISFNGAVKFGSALSAVTGGWLPEDRQVISQGTVQLAAGATAMRVARTDVFPHIKGFRLVRTADTSGGLVGQWLFDACDGTDSSGAARPASINNAACVAGHSGAGLEFRNPGTNLFEGSDWVTLPAHPSAAVTFSTWVKWNGDATSGLEYAGALWSMGVHTEQPYLSIWVNEGTGKIWTDSFTNSVYKLVPGVWTMLTITSDGAGEALYLNGELVNSAQFAAPMNFTGKTSYLARHFWASGNNAARFRGVLDGARTYSRALTPDEVRTLFAGTRVP